MNNFGFPVLSAIIFIPIVAAVVILFLDAKQRDLIRGIAAAAAFVVFFLCLFVFMGYNSLVQNPEQHEQLVSQQPAFDESAGKSAGTQMYKNGIRFEEYVPWVK